MLGFLKKQNFRKVKLIADTTGRELIFSIMCRHRQGDKQNVLLFCTRRGGSTWILNTLAAHTGTRYVNRPFMSALYSRYKKKIPSLTKAAGCSHEQSFEIFVNFEGEDEIRFREFAHKIIMGEINIYPTLCFWAPYFHRVTNRVVFQMTNTTPLIKWFDENFSVKIVILLRHPIPTALSIMAAGWEHECHNFLNHQWFINTQLKPEQVDYARQIVANGSQLERHILDWTLKMLLPIRAVGSGEHSDWLTITYEETVQNPESILSILSNRLDFPAVDLMMDQMKRPSRTVSKNTVSHIQDTNYLINRWRKKINENREKELMQIPAFFGIETYIPGQSMAINGYLHNKGKVTNETL